MKLNTEEYLPIGSVVSLKKGTKKIMIIGFLAGCINNKQMYDYAACLFPEGMVASDKTLFFNHEQIEKVYFLGYNNLEASDYRKTLNDIIVGKEQENNPEEVL